MTAPERNLGIRPETAATKVAVGGPSVYGISRKRFIVTAMGTDGEEYVQLGTPNQLRLYAKIQEDMSSGEPPSIPGAYRQQDTFLVDHKYEGLSEASYNEVRAKFTEDGGRLIEGPRYMAARPGENPVTDDPEDVAIWAPAKIALAGEWSLKGIEQI